MTNIMQEIGRLRAWNNSMGEKLRNQRDHSHVAASYIRNQMDQNIETIDQLMRVL